MCVGGIDEGSGVMTLVEVTDVVDCESESKGLLVVLIREGSGNS